jgi:hypothetical protein
LKKFFALPALPSNEKNSDNSHNSYDKGPNLAFFSFTESPSNFLLTIKFPKTHITSSYSNMPKTAMTEIQSSRALGVKNYDVENAVDNTQLYYWLCRYLNHATASRLFVAFSVPECSSTWMARNLCHNKRSYSSWPPIVTL